jgi:hypothetical protein
MAEINAMIAAVRRDRLWFHNEALKSRNHGMLIDAAACAIREKALLDAMAAVDRERKGLPPHFVEKMR